MGTRGTIRLVYKGVKKTWYVQWDADTLGSRIVRDLKLLLAAFGGDYEIIKRMVENVKIITTESPTKEQIKLLLPFADLSVSNQKLEDWYCLLRRCQNSLMLTLMAGYIQDTGDEKQQFNWVLDFDSNEFYYDKCPRFPIDDIPENWNDICNEYVASSE